MNINSIRRYNNNDATRLPLERRNVKKKKKKILIIRNVQEQVQYTKSKIGP